MARFYVEFSNPETNETERKVYAPQEIDELMCAEIIDTDHLGFAMDDTEAFDRALLKCTERSGAISYCQFVEAYLEEADKDIIVRI